MNLDEARNELAKLGKDNPIWDPILAVVSEEDAINRAAALMPNATDRDYNVGRAAASADIINVLTAIRG